VEKVPEHPGEVTTSWEGHLGSQGVPEIFPKVLCPQLNLTHHGGCQWCHPSQPWPCNQAHVLFKSLTAGHQRCYLFPNP
jgi:hypothetical protein